MIRFIAALFLVLALTTCAEKDTLQSQLIGRWEMEKVLDNDQDVTDQHNPEGNRWIAFKSDGTFESGGDPYGSNTGTYSLNYESGNLFLDSDAGEDDDSQWIIEIKGDSMMWQGTGAEWAERFKLIHLKSR